MADSESEVTLVPYEEAYEPGFEDMPRRIPDVTKIESALGWRPTLNLTQILQDVIHNEREGSTEMAVSELA